MLPERMRTISATSAADGPSAGREAAGNTTTGTTILQAIQQSVPATNVTFSLDGSGSAGADVGIVVIGETPYAEGAGDNSTLTLSSADLNAVTTMKASWDPCRRYPHVSGTSADHSRYCADASPMHSSLHGCRELKVRGVTDVLFGDYNFTGKLPHSWPRTITQIPINSGDASYDPLFPYGYGLTY
jgi:beta-glucosidase